MAVRAMFATLTSKGIVELRGLFVPALFFSRHIRHNFTNLRAYSYTSVCIHLALRLDFAE